MGSTRTDLGPMPNWTLHEYRRECAGLMRKKRFHTTAVDGKSPVVYRRSRSSVVRPWVHENDHV